MHLDVPQPDNGPWQAISWEWASGQVVPFLGAGASLMRPNDAAPWDPKTSSFLPNASELAGYLADAVGFPSELPFDRDLAKISSYYTIKVGRPSLRRALRRALASTFPGRTSTAIQPGQIHKYIAERKGPQLIVTTNYDTLIEDAFKAQGREYDLLIYPADNVENRSAALWHEAGKPPCYVESSTLELSFGKPVIYKMHGSLAEESKQDTFVISEEDYIEFLLRMITATAIPAALLAYLQSRSLLFLGYSLRDWNLRLVLRNLGGVLQNANRPRVNDQDEIIPSWAIQKRPSVVEQELWRVRGVEIFSQDIEDFACRMTSL